MAKKDAEYKPKVCVIGLDPVKGAPPLAKCPWRHRDIFRFQRSRVTFRDTRSDTPIG